MSDFRNLLEYCQSKALANKLSPTEESFWNSLCRAYSKKFHVPLPEVMKMDIEHVVLTHFEEQMDGIDIDENLENILETIYSLEDPNYDSKREKEFDEFVKRMESKEKEEKSKKTLLKEDENEKENKPRGGMLDLSYMEEIDSEG